MTDPHDDTCQSTCPCSRCAYTRRADERNARRHEQAPKLRARLLKARSQADLPWHLQAHICLVQRSGFADDSIELSLGQVPGKTHDAPESMARGLRVDPEEWTVSGRLELDEVPVATLFKIAALLDKGPGDYPEHTRRIYEAGVREGDYPAEPDAVSKLGELVE